MGRVVQSSEAKPKRVTSGRRSARAAPVERASSPAPAARVEPVRPARTAEAKPEPRDPGSPVGLAERGLALGLLLVAAPLIATLGLLLRLRNSGPVFYRGVRLGRGMRPFTMFKLRTLREDAQRITGASLLGNRHELEIRGGHFLRETRLDELPQLLNIVRGEMSFLGPRPERPEVYHQQCRAIPGYERRFAVAPGLVGVSQLFTPHGTAKRYRTLLDNHALRRPSSALRLVPLAAAMVLWQTLRRARRTLTTRWIEQRVLLLYREKRGQARFRPRGARAHLHGVAPELATARLVEIGERSLVLAFPADPGLVERAEIDVETAVRHVGPRPAWRRARCRAVCTRRFTLAGRVHLVFDYLTRTPRGAYVIDQYFLGKSLCPPRRPWEDEADLLPSAPRPFAAQELAPLQSSAPRPPGAARSRVVRAPRPANRGTRST